MEGGRITGVVGIIKWQYYNAAAINGFTVQRAKDGRWSLSATVVNRDPYKMSQSPLVFVMPTAKGTSRWPITDFELQDGRMRASLGQPFANGYEIPGA